MNTALDRSSLSMRIRLIDPGQNWLLLYTAAMTEDFGRNEKRVECISFLLKAKITRGPQLVCLHITHEAYHMSVRGVVQR